MKRDWVDRRLAAHARLHDPSRPDNMAVRMELVRRMEAGEITLEEAQAQLAALKRSK
jgi:hypothetical protein